MIRTKPQVKALVLTTLQGYVGGCREWPKGESNRCGEPSEYVLWGKLIPQDALGPRCYKHAAAHLGDDALTRRAHYAPIDLDDLADQLVAIVFPIFPPRGPETLP